MRVRLSLLLGAGKGVREIACELSRSPSTILREIRTSLLVLATVPILAYWCHPLFLSILILEFGNFLEIFPIIRPAKLSPNVREQIYICELRNFLPPNFPNEVEFLNALF